MDKIQNINMSINISTHVWLFPHMYVCGYNQTCLVISTYDGYTHTCLVIPTHMAMWE